MINLITKTAMLIASCGLLAWMLRKADPPHDEAIPPHVGRGRADQ